MQDIVQCLILAFLIFVNIYIINHIYIQCRVQAMALNSLNLVSFESNSFIGIGIQSLLLTIILIIFH